MKAVLPAAFAILVIAPAASAQVPPVRQEIVVTASAAQETLESVPAAVTVITRDEIESLAARDVADVLRTVPGLTIARTGSPGKVASLFTRGGSSKQTLVLWNGIELNNPFLSGFDIGRISTAGVERIEIARGPFSALYGSEAVSGVVQVLTRADSAFLTADVQAGEHGLLNGSISGATAVGAVRIAGSIEARTDDGFAPNDDLEQTTGHAEARWSVGPGLSLGARARVLTYDVGIPRSVDAAGTGFELRPDRRENGREIELAIPFSARFGGGEYDVTVSRMSRRDEFEDPEDPFGRTDAVTEARVLRASAVARHRFGPHALSLGGEWEDARVDDRSTYGVSLDAKRRAGRGVFVEDRVSVPLGEGLFELSAGLRLDDYETFGSHVSPRVSAAWLLGRHKMRAGYGEAFRAPAVGELYLPFFGNAALAPERSTNWELGYDRVHGAGRWSVTAFRNDFDELIVYDNRSNRFENVGAGRSAGIELGAQHAITRAWGVAISYTFVETEDADTRLPFLRRPEHSGSAVVRWSDFGWRASAAILHTGERADLTDLAPFGRVWADAVTTLDLVLERELAPGLTPYLKVENATDREYEEIFGYPSPGRRAIAGIRVELIR